MRILASFVFLLCLFVPVTDALADRYYEQDDSKAEECSKSRECMRIVQEREARVAASKFDPEKAGDLLLWIAIFGGIFYYAFLREKK